MQDPLSAHPALGNLTFKSTVKVDADSTVEVDAEMITLQGDVTGTDSMTLMSGIQPDVGTLVFSGNNSGFSGVVTLVNGHVAIGIANALGAGPLSSVTAWTRASKSCPAF